MDPREAIRKAREIISEERVLALAELISKHHRIRGSSGYDEAANALKAFMAEHGVELGELRFPLDNSMMETWRVGLAWDAQEAQVSVGGRLLCDWKESPICLVPGSFGLEGEFEVVDVGPGTEPEDYKTDVAGKLVLTTENPRYVVDTAVGLNMAVGLLVDHIPAEEPKIGRDRKNLPDAIFYMGTIPALSGRTHTFAVSLSPKMAVFLRERIKKGEKVKVKIKAGSFSGIGRVLTYTIPGKQPDQVVLVAHLCHPKPGAGDNASGAALLGELALVLRGLLKSPEYTIRFLWVPEFLGSLAWLLGNRERVVGGVNLDMVGQDQAKTKGPLVIEAPPISTPSHLPYAAEALLLEVLGLRGLEPAEGWSYVVRPFKGGSDHLVLSDPELGGPTLMLGHWPDRFYHSSEDTPDKLSGKEMVRVGLLAVGLTALLAYPTEDLSWLLEHAARAWRKELRKATEYLNYQGLCHLWRQRREDLITLAYTAKDPYAVVADVQRLSDEIAGEFGLLDPVSPIGGPVLRRKFKGPLCFDFIFERRPERKLEYRRWFSRWKDLRGSLDTIVYLSTGKGNLREHVERLMAVYPHTSEDRILEFLLELSELGLVETVNGNI